MEEKNGSSSSTERTENLNEVIGRFHSDRWYSGQQDVARETFVKFPVKEMREACLRKIYAESEEEATWLIEQVKAFLQIEDHSTVFMLLRKLAQHNGKLQVNILDLMVAVSKECLTDEKRYLLKDILVILCGKINHHPELYNEAVRGIFRSILEKYDDRETYPSDKDNLMVIRVLQSIGCVKDKTLLPLIQQNVAEPNRINALFHYVSISKEEISLEGIRLLVIKLLEETTE